MSDKHPRSRWRAPNERYPEKADGNDVRERCREQPGWFRGARVRKR